MIYTELVKRRATAIERKIEIDRLHKLGREFYDTPASVRGCPCRSCNQSRKRCGKSQIRRPIYAYEYIETDVITGEKTNLGARIK